MLEIDLSKYKEIDIIDVIYHNELHVYDIEVEDVHMFEARNPKGNISSISHNSAAISFSNLSDQRMKHAKDGNFGFENPQRYMANNSIAYTEKPDSAIFIEEWLNLMRSGSGERGIFNTKAAREKADKFGRKPGDIRSNPCLTKDTTIITNLGELNILDIIEKVKNKENIYALAYDIDNSRGEFNKITWGDKTRENTNIIEIETEDGKILKLTPDHKVYTKNRGYIEASQLTEEDILVVI